MYVHLSPIYQGLLTQSQRLRGEELRHRSVLELAENMACVLTYVVDVEQFAELAQLKNAIEEIRPLVEDTTNFIVEISSRGKIGMCCSTSLVVLHTNLAHR
jgi:hypothetical protein